VIFNLSLLGADMMKRNICKILFKCLFFLTVIAIYIGLPMQKMASVLAQSMTVNSEANRIQQAKEEASTEEGKELFRSIYRNFYDTYRLGPGDMVAIRVYGQPDYALPQAKVSPVGRIYHPLIGEVEVAGFTVKQLEKSLTEEFSEYVRDPKVTVSLEEAQSAKIGVLGEIKTPGIVIMTRPMTILEAISYRGGFTDTAKRNSVVVLRRLADGRLQTLKVDTKRIMDGKADPEENIMMRAGDTIVVDGNLRKKMASVMSVAGFAQFLTFIAFGRG